MTPVTRKKPEKKHRILSFGRNFERDFFRYRSKTEKIGQIDSIRYERTFSSPSIFSKIVDFFVWSKIFLIKMYFLLCFASPSYASMTQTPDRAVQMGASFGISESMSVFDNPANLSRKMNFLGYVSSQYNQLGFVIEKEIKKINSLKKDKEAQFNEISKLIGREVFFESELGLLSNIGNNFHVGLLANTSLNSIIRGRILPIVDSSLLIRSQLYFAKMIPFFYEQLKLGFTLKPSYKLQHRIHDDALDIFEDRSLVKPAEHANEGVGLGLDFGMLSEQKIDQHRVSLGINVMNLGAIKYHKKGFLNANTPHAPDLDYSEIGLDLKYSYILSYFWGSEAGVSFSYIDESQNIKIPTSTWIVGVDLKMLDFLSIYWGKGEARFSRWGASIFIGRLHISYGIYQNPLDLDQNTTGWQHVLELKTVF